MSRYRKYNNFWEGHNKHSIPNHFSEMDVRSAYDPKHRPFPYSIHSVSYPWQLPDHKFMEKKQEAGIQPFRSVL